MNRFATIVLRLIATPIICFFSIAVFAQITQPAIYEHPHKGNEREFFLISRQEMGITLVRDLEKFEDGKKSWEVIFLDSLLNETWTENIQIDQRMNFLGYEYRDQNIYLLFTETIANGLKLNITELLPSEKKVKHHQFKPEVTIQFTHFSVLKGKAIFGGYINREPALLMYDLQTESAKVIPGVFQTKSELKDVRNNVNDTFNAVLIEGSSNKKLIVKTFDSNGLLLVEDEIPLEGGKIILDAISTTLVHDELAVMGTWTFGTSRQAAGIFTVLIDPFHDQKINYYDFAEFNHFLDYQKPKRIAKIKAKAAWRKSVGKNPEFRTFLNPIRVEETKNGFGFLSEIYDAPINYTNNRSNYPNGYNPYNYYGYPPYGASSYVPSRYYAPYSYYPYGPTNYYPYNETRMVHTSLIFFDAHAQLTSDIALKFPEIKLNSKEQVSDFLMTKKNQTVLACKKEREIFLRIFNPDSTLAKAEQLPIQLKNQNETVRTEAPENSSIRFWYGNCFYFYGYHQLINEQEKSSHQVFYINKLKVE